MNDMDDAVGNTLSRFVGRYLVPVMLTVVAWFGVRSLNSIEENQVTLQKNMEAQAVRVQQVSSDLQLLNAKVDFSVLQQITVNSRRLDLLEAQGRVMREKQP